KKNKIPYLVSWKRTKRSFGGCWKPPHPALATKVTRESTGSARMLASMGVSVCMLASGSRGNCAIVSSTHTKILIDAGISCRETFKRMKSLGDDPRSLAAVLITHEHSDHVYGLA